MLFTAWLSVLFGDCCQELRCCSGSGWFSWPCLLHPVPLRLCPRVLEAVKKCPVFPLHICETPHCTKLCLHRCKKQLQKFAREKNRWRTVKYKDPIYDREIVLSHRSLEVGGEHLGKASLCGLFVMLPWHPPLEAQGPVSDSAQLLVGSVICSAAKQMFGKLKAEDVWGGSERS